MSEMWNNVAPGWEANATYIDDQLAAATQALLNAAAVGQGNTVLDLACGPGGAGLAAAERVGSAGRVVLSDVATEMVAAAGRRASGSPQVSTAVFDQSAIAVADTSFDAVISRHGLMFAESPIDAVAEAARVLRPAGRYAAMTWDRRDLNPWLGLVLDAVGDQFGVPFPPPSVRSPFSLQDAALLTSVLQDGGLTDVTVQTISTPMRASSVDEWWRRVPQLAGPLAAALAGMDAADRDAIADRAMRLGAAAAQSDDDGFVLPGSVLIGSGRRPER
jgi:SAM-dependent methyltransferase